MYVTFQLLCNYILLLRFSATNANLLCINLRKTSVIAGVLQRDHRKLELEREVVGGSVQHPHSGGGRSSAGQISRGETPPHRSTKPVVRWTKFGRPHLRGRGQGLSFRPSHR